MSELMEGNVSTATVIRWSMEDMIPENDHHSSSPGFARPHFISFHNDVPHHSSHPRDRIRIGINQNRLQAGIIIVLEMKQKNTGVGGNANGVGENLFVSTHIIAVANSLPFPTQVPVFASE